MKTSLKIGVAIAAIALVVLGAFIVGMATAEVAPGDRYEFTTTHGEAQMLSDGEWTNATASIRLTLEVTEVGPRSIGFTVVGGEVTVGGETYTITGGFGVSTTRRLVILSGDASGGTQYAMLIANRWRFPMGSVSSTLRGVLKGEGVYAVFWVDGVISKTA